MAGLVPAIHALAGIPLIASRGVFFCILLGGAQRDTATYAGCATNVPFG
jgi:hypothetical protein